MYPIVIEMSEYMGGISRTVNYKGNRIDIGGHRFFSKSDRVMNWWLAMMPVEPGADDEITITYQRQSRDISTRAVSRETDPGPIAHSMTGQTATPTTQVPNPDTVLLVRSRRSRIYFLRKLFEYPIRLSVDTLTKLGVLRVARIGFSYVRAALFPIRPETNLEEFFVNRFGRELYSTFFESYTEKVWGVPCRGISAEWGAQRIKGLSIAKTVMHMFKKVFSRGSDLAQKNTETSLIERFLYPKHGPGQMWEEVARRVREMGGEIHTGLRVSTVRTEGDSLRIAGVDTTRVDRSPGPSFEGDFFFSTMPVRELIAQLDCPVPADVRAVSDGLVYRDFLTVGLLVRKLELRDKSEPGRKLIRDNWIYIQEPDVQVGRLQIFNNWSPHLVADPDTVWIGLEYFCNDTDDLWKMTDSALYEFARMEMERIGILAPGAVLDATVIRMPKTYPAYFGTYDEFHKVRDFVDAIDNLFLVGRNGMHKYNNQDHSMLTAMTAVDNIAAGRTDKSNIWDVNAEREYHEEK